MAPTVAQVLDRRSLLAPLTGTVLEIGPGRGINLRHYRPDVEWIGVEPARRKHRSIRSTGRRLGRSITLHDGTAEALPLADQSVDAVVATFVLCSVADQDRTIDEIQRVLRPGAPFLFLEHVGAAPDTPSRRLQNGWTRLGVAQCRPNRDTGPALERAGFAGVHYTSTELRPLGLRLPVIRGTAVRPA